MDEATEYRLNVGHDHENLPEDHPDVWQWRYGGGRSERDELLQRLTEDELQEKAEQEALW